MANVLKPASMAAALLLSTSNAVAAQGITRDFDVDGRTKLVVEAEGAKIEVRGGGDTIGFDIRWGNDDADHIREHYRVDFIERSDSVRLDFERRGGWRSGWFKRSPVITVAVPERFDVDLSTSGGRVDIHRVAGSIEARTSGGSLHFLDVDGPIYGRTSGGAIHFDGASTRVDLKTSGGSIRIGHVDGEVRAETSGGGISIEHAGGPVFARTSGGAIRVDEVHGAVEARTSGGSITVGIAEQPRADSSLRTSGGGVTVFMLPSIAVNLDASASGGKVRSELPVMMRVEGSVSERRINGEINGGGPKLSVRASGGSVNLKAL